MFRGLSSLGVTLALTISLARPSMTQRQVDIDAVDRFLDRFAELEDALDEMAQAALMSDDRVWIGQGVGRRTNQALNTRIQLAQQEALKESVPGIQSFTDYRDSVIRSMVTVPWQ